MISGSTSGAMISPLMARAAREAVARDGACRADAEDGAEDGGRDADDQAVPGGVEQGRRVRQFLVPFER